MSGDQERARWRENKQAQRARGLGVDCRPPEIRREQWRLNKRKHRLLKQEHAALHKGSCQVRRNGSGKRCGATLETQLERDGWGVVIGSRVICPSCERRRAGLCQVCDRAVAGRVGFALYCDDAECKRRVRKAYRCGLDPRRLRAARC